MKGAQIFLWIVIFPDLGLLFEEVYPTDTTNIAYPLTVLLKGRHRYPGEENVAEISRERTKLLNRVKRIRGQIDAVERTLAAEENCTDVLMLLAAARGGINGLMAEVLEDHIRLHLLQEGRNPLTPDLGEELIDLVRAYLK